MTSQANSFNEIQSTPKEVYFRSLNQGEKQKSTLTLTNPTKSRYAFKVKTTCPKCYVVKPSVGFLEPESTFKITLIKELNPKPSIVDKFIIEAMKTSEKRANTVEAQMRAANKRSIRLIKVPVFVEGPSTDDSSEGLHAIKENKTPAKQLTPRPFYTAIPPVLSPLPQSLPQAPSPSVEAMSLKIRPTSTSARDGLVVINNSLTFKYDPASSITSHIRLYNPTDDRLAFKVRNTFPRGFKVKPSQGFIKPRSSAEIEVLLLNSRAVDFCYSKFLVQSFAVDFSDEIITEAMYHKAKLYKAVRETELDVKLIGFEEEEVHDSVSVVEEKNAAAAYEIRYLRNQIMSLKSEIQSLKRQFRDQTKSGDLIRSQNIKQEESTAFIGYMSCLPFFGKKGKLSGRFVM